MNAAPADAAESTSRSEESVIRSLAELRAIELQRQTAERDAWLQIEALEATERARRLVALEEHRMAAELAVQREAVLRRRPRGLLALSAAALAAAAGLGWLALDQVRAATLARDARDRALAAVDRAERATGEARLALEQTAHELAQLRARFDAIVGAARPPVAAAAPGAPGPAPRAADPHTAPAGTRSRPTPPPPPRQPVKIRDDCLANAVCDEPPPSAAPSAARRM